MDNFRAPGAGGKQPARAVSFCARRAQGVQRGSAASGPTPCGDAGKGDILFLGKRISPLHPQEKGRGESPLDPRHWQFVARITAHAAQCGCGVHGFAMNPCELLLLSTAPYYREARVTFAWRRTACRMRHCCARRIVECPDRRELLRTSTRWAERQRIVGASQIV